MTLITQKLKLRPELLPSEEIKITIPRRGDIKPSEEKIGFSVIPKIQHIVTFHSSTYTPGKVTFEEEEE